MQVSDAHVVRDRDTGQSRGFGFITFVDPAVARAVMMTDHKIDGRDVMARRATPKPDGTGGGMGGGMGGGGMVGGMVGGTPSHHLSRRPGRRVIGQ